MRGATIRELVAWARERGKPLTYRQVRTVVERADRAASEATTAALLLLAIGEPRRGLSTRLLRVAADAIAVGLFHHLRGRAGTTSAEELATLAKAVHDLARAHAALAPPDDARAAQLAVSDDNSSDGDLDPEWFEAAFVRYPHQASPLDLLSQHLHDPTGAEHDPDPPGSPSGMPNGPDRPASS